MLILGIESSCDDTAVALYDSEQGVRAHQLHTQLLHARFGGVVPELAARDHIRTILTLVDQALSEAQCTRAELKGVAYTAGPGLVGALMVGASVGRSLAYALNIPSLGVHHMEAHLMVTMLQDPKPAYPFLALLVSGGHTLLLEVLGLGDYRLLGESLDDAVGEAFDKTAKLLGLPYPGGLALAKLAEGGRPGRFEFPRPMLHQATLNFSFSGLKTFAMNTLRQQTLLDEQTKADIAYAFQEAAVDSLVSKCEKAVQQTGIDRLVMVGGVSANQHLRTELQRRLRHSSLYYLPLNLCTDNGVMVAYLGFLRMSRGECDLDKAIRVHPRWPLVELNSPL